MAARFRVSCSVPKPDETIAFWKEAFNKKCVELDRIVGCQLVEWNPYLNTQSLLARSSKNQQFNGVVAGDKIAIIATVTKVTNTLCYTNGNYQGSIEYMVEETRKIER